MKGKSAPWLLLAPFLVLFIGTMIVPIIMAIGYSFTRVQRLGLLGEAGVDSVFAGLEDYIGWLAANFDPSISWKDLEWIREFWKGPMLIKGILDADDARDAVRFGADGIVVSNHGGRQLDGVLSSARALPAIADAVKGDIKLLADSGIRTGLDVVRMLALGADAVLLGRAWLYALAAAGGAGVEHLLGLIEKDHEGIAALPPQES